MSTRAFAVFVALAALVPAGAARADLRAYRGAHPFDLDGHWHLEEAVHVHDDLATGADPFAEVDGVRVFLADPLAWGYGGEIWTYRGVHPLPGALVAYCGLTGEHRHAFAPEGTYRREPGGEYVFTGAMRGGVALLRPIRAAPARAIASRRPPSAAPVWALGCFLVPVIGPDGVTRMVPSVDCPLIAERREPPPPRSALPAPAYTGPYSRTHSVPLVMERDLGSVRQARDH